MLPDLNTWHWPQWALAILWALSLMVSASMHGKPRDGKYSFWVGASGIAVGVAILYFGNFWTP